MDLYRTVMARQDGHLYATMQFYSYQTWPSANNAVETEFEPGTTDWHLVAISDAAENSFVTGFASHAGAKRAYIGLVKTFDTTEPDGAWHWSNGEDLTYTNWYGRGPEDSGIENYSYMYLKNFPATFWFSIEGTKLLTSFTIAELNTYRAVKLEGYDGNDKLLGAESADWLAGKQNNDTLDGGGGDDTLRGGSGADILRGGLGQDVLIGGADGDKFVFTSRISSRPGNADHIRDFETGIDVIDLDQIDADRITDGVQQFHFIGTAAFSGTAGELRVATNDSGNSLVRADTDGDGHADFLIVLRGVSAPEITDFLL